MRAHLATVAVAATVALAGGCFYTNAFSNASKMKKIQKRDLERALPAVLEVESPVPGEARTAHVRIWVDEDFRAQNVRWRTQIEEQLDEANQFLVPAVGIRLEVKTIEPWPTRSADQRLADVLAALEAQDPGDDVDWVIGYASSLSLIGASFEQLGYARMLGRHLVVRGYADAPERKNFLAAFPDTSADDRERVHQARRRHKQTTILLHEIGHTLGAPHETEASWLLHGTYDINMATLSQPSRELMRLTLETWINPRSTWDRRAVAARLVSYFEANPWGGWVADELAEFTAELRATSYQSGATGPGPALTVPAAAFDQYRRAGDLARAGKLAEAKAELDSLVAAYPATPDIRQAICEVAVAADGPSSPSATKACERAAQVAPDDPRPYFARVGPLLTAGDRTAAFALLARVEAIAGDRGDVWLSMATLYQGQTLVTRAEAAAARANALTAASGDDVLAWGRRTRARYGLPPRAAKWRIAELDEGAFVTAVRELLDAIYANQLDDAKVKAAAADKKWKGAPGLLAARCDLALRSNQIGQARALCDQAIAAWSGAAWAMYLRGVLRLQDGKTKPAIASLRAAITAEPELGQAYRALAKAYDRASDADGRAALAIEYEARFRSKLP